MALPSTLEELMECFREKIHPAETEDKETVDSGLLQVSFQCLHDQPLDSHSRFRIKIGVSTSDLY